MSWPGQISSGPRAENTRGPVPVVCVLNRGVGSGIAGTGAIQRTVGIRAILELLAICSGLPLSFPDQWRSVGYLRP